MRRYVPWLFAVVVGILLALPAPGLAAGVTMDPLPAGGYTVRFVNPRWGWRVLATPMDLLSTALGTDGGGPCDGQLITFRSMPPDFGNAVPVRWSIFSDVDRGHNLTDGTLALRPIGGTPLCPGAKQPVVLNADGVQSYIVTVQPTQPERGIRPGTYAGQAVVSGIDGVIPVTLKVRDGIGMALFFAMLGLLANWLLNRFRTQEAILPFLTRYRRLTRRLLACDPPLLLEQLSHWIYENLHTGTADGQAKTEKEISIAEMVMSPEFFPVWIQELNDLRAGNDYAWRLIREAIESQPTDTMAALFKSVAAQVQQFQLLGTPLTDPTPASAPPPTGSPADQAPPPPLRAPLRTPPPVEALKGVPVLSGKWLSWRGNAFLGEWLFAGSLSLGMRVIRLGIFAAAVAATALATVTAYKKIPDFGADMLVDYGIAFGMGYTGKAFNDILQKLAPNLVSAVSVNQGMPDSHPAGQSPPASS